MCVRDCKKLFFKMWFFLLRVPDSTDSFVQTQDCPHSPFRRFESKDKTERDKKNDNFWIYTLYSLKNKLLDYLSPTIFHWVWSSCINLKHKFRLYSSVSLIPTIVDNSYVCHVDSRTFNIDCLHCKNERSCTCLQNIYLEKYFYCEALNSVEVFHNKNTCSFKVCVKFY